MFECRNHPGADAVWMCAGCEGVFCNDCVTARKVGTGTIETCKGCGELCRPVRAAIEVRPDERVESLVGAFAYPLRQPGPYVLAGGTLFAWVLGFAAMGGILGWGVLLGYAMTIIQTTARGRSQAPDWPEVSTIGDILQPTLLAFATACVSFGPALWALGNGSPALAASLGLLGAVYAPMAWIAASISERLLSITPLTVLPLLLRVDGSYWVACGVLVVLAAAGELAVGAVEALGLPLIGSALATGLGFYLLMVEMRILGLVWLRNQESLGLS